MKRPSRFKPSEMADMAGQFKIHAGPLQTGAASVRCADLLDRNACAAYLDDLAPDLRSPSRWITASLFSKRFVFLYAVPVLYAMSNYDKGWEISLRDMMLEQPASGSGKWSPALHAEQWRVTEFAEGRREEWRSELIGTLFAECLAPLWRALSEASNIPMAILWENTAVRLFSLYEKRLAQQGSPQKRERVQEDFAFLVTEAPGSLFGARANPLARFYTPAAASSEEAQPARTRRTCCYNYKAAADGSFCSVCPKANRAARGKST